MREVRRYELDNGSCVEYHALSDAVIEVARGWLWITLDHDPNDYWITAGGRMAVPTGRMAWLSAERGAAELCIAATARPAHGVRDWLRSALVPQAGMLSGFGNNFKK